MMKCTLFDNVDIEDEYHVTLVCQQFKNIRIKYINKYYYMRPSMLKFIELIHVDTKREQFKLMLFIKYLIIKEDLLKINKIILRLIQLFTSAWRDKKTERKEK